MKRILITSLTFVTLSLMPFLWNKFSFIEVGFPFSYLKTVTFKGSFGTGTKVSFDILNLIGDFSLATIGVLLWFKFIKDLRDEH